MKAYMNDTFAHNVVYELKRIVRNQMCDSMVPRNVEEYIIENNLLVERWWPAYMVRLSDAGRDFIAEYSSED